MAVEHSYLREIRYFKQIIVVENIYFHPHIRGHEKYVQITFTELSDTRNTKGGESKKTNRQIKIKNFQVITYSTYMYTGP